MQKTSWRQGARVRTWGVGFQTAGYFQDIRVVVLSDLVKVAFPSLFLSSLPKRAIGFSYPSGREGRLIGVVLVVATEGVAALLFRLLGPIGVILALWLLGGTAGLVLYNSTRERVAFVKEYCSSCRLRPLIEEHEAMHLYGEPGEEEVWAEARRKYSYKALGLADDPKICSFCPIAKKLRN